MIGGGVSGIMCGVRLQELGLRPVVFDTGKRAVGGRASSRILRCPDAVAVHVDHSCQFFVAQRKPFAERVRQWHAAGLVAPWGGAVGTLSRGSFARCGDDGSADDALCRWVGCGGMGELWSRVAADGVRDIRRPLWVSELRQADGKWTVVGERCKVAGIFDFVVVAHNGKCAERLMSTANVPRVHRLLKCRFAPAAEPSCGTMSQCSLWLCVLVFDASLGLPFGGANVIDHPDLAWVANNNTKQGMAPSSGHESWTLLSTRQFGTANKCPQENIPPRKREEVTARLFAAFLEAAGIAVGSVAPIHTYVQLWGAAVPINTCGVDVGGACYLDAAAQVGVCGDWFSAPSIEGAAESGLALAEQIAKQASAQAAGGAGATAPSGSGVGRPFRFVATKTSAFGDAPLSKADAVPLDSGGSKAMATAARQSRSRRGRRVNPGQAAAVNGGSSGSSGVTGGGGGPISGGSFGAASVGGRPRGQQHGGSHSGGPVSGGSTGLAAIDTSSTGNAGSGRGRGGGRGRSRGSRGRGRGRDSGGRAPRPQSATVRNTEQQKGRGGGRGRGRPASASSSSSSSSGRGRGRGRSSARGSGGEAAREE